MSLDMHFPDMNWNVHCNIPVHHIRFYFKLQGDLCCHVPSGIFEGGVLRPKLVSERGLKEGLRMTPP